MGLFKRKYNVDVVVYRSPEGKPCYYKQWESGSKNTDLKRKAAFCIEEILEGRPVAAEESEIGEIFIPQGYKFKSDFQGVALLRIGIIEGEKEPIIEFITDIRVKKRGILDS